MLKGSMQRVGVVLALVGALLLAAPLPGSADPVGRSATPREGLWEQVVDWLCGWWSGGGGGSSARELTSMRGEQGMGIDPNGGHSPVTPGTSAAPTPSGDQGAGIDPDGRL